MPKTYEMIVDGKIMIKEGFLLSFANSSQYGNNMRIAPKAKLDNGYLELVILKAFPKHAIMDILYRFRKGTLNRCKYYESHKCKKVIIKEKDLRMHIDGEPVTYQNGVKIKILPKALKVIVP